MQRPEKDIEKKWVRLCPECEKDIKYTLRWSLVRANKNNSLCKRCSQIGRIFTDEHKTKISNSSKGRKGYWKDKTMSKETLYKNMKTHLQWDVELDFLKQFENIEKLKYINSMLTRSRVSCNFNTVKYKEFVLKFYYDEQFLKTYEDYLLEDKASYAKPSLDHKIPLSRGGTWEISNLQVISWVENRAKYTYLPDEWEYLKQKYFKKGE